MGDYKQIKSKRYPLAKKVMNGVWYCPGHGNSATSVQGHMCARQMCASDISVQPM